MEQQEHGACGSQRIIDIGQLAFELIGATIECAEASEPIFDPDDGLCGFDWLSLQIRTPDGQRISLTLTVEGTADAPSILVAEASYLPCA